MSGWFHSPTVLDKAGEGESYPLASLMEIAGVLIERYEEEHAPKLAK